jgi:hypothetical protein
MRAQSHSGEKEEHFFYYSYSFIINALGTFLVVFRFSERLVSRAERIGEAV